MKQIALAFVLALATAAAGAQSLNGSWNLVAQGTPHGDLHFQATFAHGAGNALTATVTLFDMKIDMTGEFKDDAFTVSGAHQGGTLSLSGKLRADGTLAGFMSNEQGDLTWTGTRAGK
jgi:hypothetical protein